MNLQSLKTRFVGSYLLLLLLFMAQIPIIYVIMNGMGEKYVQEDVAGSLRKRAVEIPEILNRHILTGDEALENIFQKKKAEYGSVINLLREGSNEMAAITDQDILNSLVKVEHKWAGMVTALNDAMRYGDETTEGKDTIRNSMFATIEKLNRIIAAEKAFNDPEITEYVDMTGLQRMRTVMLNYYIERFMVASTDSDEVALVINKTVSDFSTALATLKVAAASTVGRGAKGTEFITAVEDLEKHWKVRKAAVVTTLAASELYRNKTTELAEIVTPEVVSIADQLTKSFISKAQGSARTGVLIIVLCVLVSALLALFFMVSANSTVIRPITRMKEVLRDYANGDLTQRTGIKIKFLGREINDEVSELAQSADVMADNMSGMIGRIVDSSSQLATASEQLSANSTQMNDGANRQSDQIATISTAMDEMSATVIEVAKNSQNVSESALSAQEIAFSGGNVVQEAKSAMQDVKNSSSVTGEIITRLGASSEQIGSIVSVINDIAEQTNLLALNAAIEAARAGDQGRGFAVVADEVRKLAEKTTVSTKEISTMINSIQSEASAAVETMDESTHKIENGVTLVNEAGEALENIVSAIQGVSEKVAQIATATEEQSATTDEIKVNMESISEVAITNVSAIVEVTTATNDLSELSCRLKDLVAGFKVSKASKDAGTGSDTGFTGETSGKAGEPKGRKSKVLSIKACA